MLLKDCITQFNKLYIDCICIVLNMIWVNTNEDISCGSILDYIGRRLEDRRSYTLTQCIH